VRTLGNYLGEGGGEKDELRDRRSGGSSYRIEGKRLVLKEGRGRQKNIT